MVTRPLHPLAVILLALLVLAGPFAFATGDVAATSHAPTIESFEYTGDAGVQMGEDNGFLWMSSEHEFEVTLQTGSSGMDADICLEAASGSEVERLTCVAERLSSNSSVTVTLSVDSWSENVTGDQTITVTVSDAEAPSDRALATAEMNLTVVERDGDYDSDDLTNEDEISAGTRIDVDDTDGDGLLDGEEVNVYGTDPTKTDTDGDGLTDWEEVELYQTDPTLADSDEDGLNDGLEVTRYGTNPNNADTDGDGLTDKEEVNSYQTDPLDADTDDDGLGDRAEVNEYETDPNDPDTDGDGLLDGEEVNIYGTDPTTADTDGDGLTDLEEVTEYQTDPTLADTDDDGLEDGAEINVYGTNPNKADTDGDGMNDGDEVSRGSDPTVPNDHPQSGFLGPIGTDTVPLSGVVLALVLLVAAVAISHRVGTLGAVLGRASSEADESDDPSGATPPESPITTLSKPEQILAILDQRGGQIRQSEIVTETGWSKSTVSRTLSKMEQRGDVVKIDVGRGNLITRPGSEPENSRSPHDH